MKEKTKRHPNFYETVEEACMRLTDTVVMYDEEPYYVLCVTDHKDDGIFRVYLDPLNKEGMLEHHHYSVPHSYYQENPDGPSRGDKMDEYLLDRPDSKILRKTMNSPKFNKFRPFPLGLVQMNKQVIYSERNPTRYTQQGLRQGMLTNQCVTLVKKQQQHTGINIFSGRFYDTIMGLYPSAQDSLSWVTDQAKDNSAIAFSRQFSLLRGPVRTIFLGYRNEVVGYLPSYDTVHIPKEFWHLAEVISEVPELMNINKV